MWPEKTLWVVRVSQCLQGLPECLWAYPRAGTAACWSPPIPAVEGPLCAALPLSAFSDIMLMVHDPPWCVYLDHSKPYNQAPHFPPLLPPGVGHQGGAVLGLQLRPEGLGQILVLSEGREWRLAILPSLCQNPRF